jgi:hypothetical protein
MDKHRLLVFGQTNCTLGLVRQGILILIGIATQGVAGALASRFLALKWRIDELNVVKLSVH